MLTTKKSGDLCPCIDVLAVSNAILPDRCPLPTAEELNWSSILWIWGVFFKNNHRQSYLYTWAGSTSQPLWRMQGCFNTNFCFWVSAQPLAVSRRKWTWYLWANLLRPFMHICCGLNDIVVHWPTTDVHNEQLTMVSTGLSKHKLSFSGKECLCFASWCSVLAWVETKLNRQQTRDLRKTETFTHFLAQYIQSVSLLLSYSF